MSDDWLRHELEMLEASAPTEVPGGLRSPRRTRLLAPAAAVLAIAALLAIAMPNLMEPTATEPSASPSAASTDTPASSETEEASARPSSAVDTPEPSAPGLPAVDLQWSKIGGLDDSAFVRVTHVVALDGMLVATGIAYEQGLPPIPAPTPPYAARVWISADGRHWEAVNIGNGFANVDLGEVIVRSDGLLQAFGSRGKLQNGYLNYGEAATWVSEDGRTWVETQSELPREPTRIVHGAAGYLAVLVAPDPEGAERSQLWHSTDGMAWDRVRTYHFHASIGAGDEGFVAATTVGEDDSRRFAIEASANGRDWLTSADVPDVMFPDVLSLGGDWILINDDQRDDRRGQTWFSANGLDWSARGRIPLAEVTVAPDTTCNEFIRGQFPAGPWLVVPTELAYPCDEGFQVTHGAQYLSVDGATWSAIPIQPGDVGDSPGATVFAGIPFGRALILVGEEAGEARIWFGEPR